MATITQDSLTNAANELAREYNFASVQDFQNAYRTAIGSASDVSQAEAATDAASFVAQLLQKCLYQEIDSGYNIAGYGWATQIDTKHIEQGNSEEWLHPIFTGGGDYQKELFVPDLITDPQTASWTLKFLNPDQTLTRYAFRFKKQQTIIEEKYIPYFMSGKLRDFVNRIISGMQTSYELFKIAKVQQLIGDMLAGQTDLNQPPLVQRRINGTATEFLKCFTDDIYPELTAMTLLNKKYNLSPVSPTPITGTPLSDLLMFVNQSVYTRLTGGEMASTFNNQLINPGRFIPLENIYPMGDLVKYTDNATPIDVQDDTPIIPEDTILVIDKNAIKLRDFVKRNEAQTYTNNLALQLTMHQWGVYGVVPWKQGFIYRNTALKRNPTA